MANRYAFKRVAKAEDGDFVIPIHVELVIAHPQEIPDAVNRATRLYDEAILEETGNTNYTGQTSN